MRIQFAYNIQFVVQPIQFVVQHTVRCTTHDSGLLFARGRCDYQLVTMNRIDACSIYLTRVRGSASG